VAAGRRPVVMVDPAVPVDPGVREGRALPVGGASARPARVVQALDPSDLPDRAQREAVGLGLPGSGHPTRPVAPTTAGPTADALAPAVLAGRADQGWADHPGNSQIDRAGRGRRVHGRSDPDPASSRPGAARVVHSTRDDPGTRVTGASRTDLAGRTHSTAPHRAPDRGDRRDDRQ
jgi:hypothetical protein